MRGRRKGARGCHRQTCWIHLSLSLNCCLKRLGMYIERFASTIEWFVFVYHLYAYIVYILQNNSLDLYIYMHTCMGVSQS